jgi:protein-L-isoaspartate O-methyltransferase
MRSALSPVAAVLALIGLLLLALIACRKRREGLAQRSAGTVSITGEKEWAASYDDTGPGQVATQFAAALVSQHAPKNFRVFVVDAGTGAGAAAMRRLGHSVVAYDSSGALVAKANASDPGSMQGAATPTAALAKAGDGQLGAVVASDPRVYSAGHAALAEAASEKLKPGGVLIVSVLDHARLQKSYTGTLSPGTKYSATLAPVDGERDAYLYVERASGKKTFMRKTKAVIPPMEEVAAAVGKKGYVLKSTYDLGKVGGDAGHNLCVFQR